jgi:acetyl-CoA carboxylase carboxyl transferase subunit alpha
LKPVFLDFEQPIAELAQQIEALELLQAQQAETGGDTSLDVRTEIDQLQAKSDTVLKNLYKQLSPWQVVQVSRHSQRPYTLDYINAICTDFHELHGDRHFADDGAIVGGLARLDGQPVMVIGHQKGRQTKEKIARNFGMPRPEGFRKAERLMRLAEKFGIPVLTFVDTQGGYPGMDAEERNQSEAIGKNLYVMAELRVPIIASVIGEGGSGGALAIAVSDQTLMLQYATFATITPEGCASILWRSAAKAPEAAAALNITADRLHELGLVDEVVPEPLGGAHRDYELAAANLKTAIKSRLADLQKLDADTLVAQRLTRLLAYGEFAEVTV